MGHLAKVLSVQSRPVLSRNGRPSNEVAIEIETVLGSTGTLTLEQNQYNMMSDDELREFLENEATLLDRAHMVTG